MVKVHNIRLGFACNSSSTHSVVLLGADVARENRPRDNKGAKQSDFGWGFFTAASKKTKLNYLGYAIYYDLIRTFPPNIAELLVDELISPPDFSIERRSARAGKRPEGHIDHQSVWTLPRTWDGRFVNQDFVKDLKGFLLRDDVVILGGNDNDDTQHPLTSTGDLILQDLPEEDSGGDWVARRTAKSQWTLFSRATGHKSRISFDPASVAPDRLSIPELVDVKITSYCPFFSSSATCRSCYQGSDTSGTHASLEDITEVANALAKVGVFEVALGGGEPTLHPQFVEVLKVFRDRGVVPNFTTRTLKWARDEAAFKSVMDLCGTFAFSIENAAGVEELRQIRDHGRKLTGSWRFAPVAQVVLGSISLDDLRDIFVAANNGHINVTALGWKQTGRGGAGPIHNVSGWVAAAKDADLYHIGVDTEALRQWREELPGNIKLLTTPEEGRFSAYWDVVEKKFGPSSFCDRSLMVDASDPVMFDIESAMGVFP